MCKLLIMTGITEGLVAEEFMRQIAGPMSGFNNHGIGYSAVGSDGKLFSQRWLNNDQFFDKSRVMTPEIAQALAPYATRLPAGALESNYSELGNIDFTDVKTVTMHTRYATCGREFANTHPFIYEDTSLIHNGTIRNAFSTHYSPGLNVNKISTCDSEAALQTYLSRNVNTTPANAKDWLHMLSGTWAYGILTRDENGKRILDVVRGTSMLYYMEIDGLGGVFTTDETDAIQVVKRMQLALTKEPILVASNNMYRYDAITGEFLTDVDIKPVTYYSSDSKRGGKTTTKSGTSSSLSNKSSTSNVKRPGENLISLVDTIKDEPDAMLLMPDIFTDKSTIKDLKLDYRKVKKHCNDTSLPMIERLDIFDLVFNSNYTEKYECLTPQVREYVRDVDFREGLKSARTLINQLYEKASNAG